MQEHERLERRSLEIEKTRELDKPRQEAEELTSQQRFAKME